MSLPELAHGTEKGITNDYRCMHLHRTIVNHFFDCMVF